MDNLTNQYNQLNRILKAIQHPGITIDQAKDLFNEGSDISSKMVKCIEGLTRDADSYTIE